MPRNKHQVPLKQWRKWSDGAREMFNALFSDFRVQADNAHPDAARLPRAHWKTLRWNFAWYAASLHDELGGRGFTSLSHPGGR